MTEELLDLSGARVGRYEVLTLLGRGGMGAVYDAIDPTLGRHVALKILPTHLARDPQRLARFVQEARAASALNHPNVVAIYEIGHDQVDGHDIHFIAMEKIEGRDLRASLAGTRLAPDRAIELVAQVADAVAAAHAAGIVHRDLKPENIVLSKNGQPKVLDFGLAKLLPDDEQTLDGNAATAVQSTDSGMILGTVGYMSPEQAQGRRADHRSDIFSLGCILYETVTGRRAFAAGSSVETLNAIIHRDPPPLRESTEEASSELQRIASKAIAKNPDERYQSAREMVIDLRALLRAPSRPAAESKPARRVGWAIGIAAILLAILAVGIVAMVMRSRREPAVAARHAPMLSMRRITSRGTVIHAAISPDGRFVAFALLDRTIRLRQLATGEEIEIAGIAPLVFWGLTFTPDSNSIIYVARDEQSGIGSCFRVATIGGRPEHLFDGVDSAPAISSDGKRIAWARAEYPHPGESALMVANVDGTNMHPVAVRRPPERFAPLFFSGPSWSPDGKWIAAPMQHFAQPRTSQLILVDPTSGAQRTLLDGWKTVTQTQWLADGSGIVTVGAKDSDDITRLQLWLIAYPSGTPTPITTEIAAYRGVSLATQQDLLVSIVVENNSQLWSAALDSHTEATKLSSGRYDGWRGLTLTPDGNMIFTNTEDQVQTLVRSRRDGSGRERVTRDSFVNQFPVSFKSGIVYVSSTPSGTELCVTDLEGDGRRVLASDVDAAPVAVSPDGSLVVFSRNRRLIKMPLAGGAATPLLDAVASAPTFSPGGDRIALLLGDSDTYAARLGVVSIDGKLSWSTPLGGVHSGSTVRWMPDASGLITNSSPEGITDDRNLWLFPFKGKPRRVTDFSDQRAYFCELTADGRTAILARANLTRDAVMMSGFR